MLGAASLALSLLSLGTAAEGAASAAKGAATGAAAPVPAPARGFSPGFQSAFKTGVFSYDTLESTMFAWQGKHFMMEGIGCGAEKGRPFWANDSAIVPGAVLDPAFANHSYIRIREVGSGRVVVNVPSSQGYGFPNAHVDYEHSAVWLFATPIDRCGNSRFNKSAHWVQSWRSSAADLGELGSWTTAVAGGTEGYAVPNVDVGRVIMADDEFAQRRLPPHKAIMIGEAAEFHLNNQQDGDLTKGWVKSKYVVQDHSKHGLGCPSVRFGTDGYYYVISGMGCCWNGIARSRDLVAWTYGRGTCTQGQPGPGCPERGGACCGAVNRPAPGDLTIGPLNAWFASNAPPVCVLYTLSVSYETRRFAKTGLGQKRGDREERIELSESSVCLILSHRCVCRRRLSTGWSKQDFKLNADPLNQPIWNGDNNDPDVCCQVQFSQLLHFYRCACRGCGHALTSHSCTCRHLTAKRNLSRTSFMASRRRVRRNTHEPFALSNFLVCLARACLGISSCLKLRKVNEGCFMQANALSTLRCGRR